jgi:hypothetical protein
MSDPDPFMLFQEASPTAIEVPVLKVFDGDGFRTKIALRRLTGNPNDLAEVDAIRFGFIGEFGHGRTTFTLGPLKVRNIMIAVRPQKNQKPLKNVQRKAVLEAW